MFYHSNQVDCYLIMVSKTTLRPVRPGGLFYNDGPKSTSPTSQTTLVLNHWKKKLSDFSDHIDSVLKNRPKIPYSKNCLAKGIRDFSDVVDVILKVSPIILQPLQPFSSSKKNLVAWNPFEKKKWSNRSGKLYFFFLTGSFWKKKFSLFFFKWSEKSERFFLIKKNNDLDWDQDVEVIFSWNIFGKTNFYYRFFRNGQCGWRRRGGFLTWKIIEVV